MNSYITRRNARKFFRDCVTLPVTETDKLRYTDGSILFSTFVSEFACESRSSEIAVSLRQEFFMSRSTIIVTSLITLSALPATATYVSAQTQKESVAPAPASAKFLAIQTLLAEKRVDDAEKAAWSYWKEAGASKDVKESTEARLALERVSAALWTTPTQGLAERLTLHSRILAIARQTGQPEQLINALQTLGYSYYNISQFDEAIACYKEAIAISEKNNLPVTSTLLHITGLNYERKSDFETAIVYYQKALDLALSENSTVMADFCYNGLGNVYSGVGKYEAAIACLEKSMAIRKERKDEFRVIVSLNNIGRVYRNAGQLDTARTYFEQSLAGIDARGIPDSGEGFNGWVLNGLGDVAKRQGRLAEAEEYCERAVAQWEIRLRELDSLPQAKSAFYSSKSECYYNYLDVLLRRAGVEKSPEKLAKAFALMQTMKARALTERMQQARPSASLSLSPQQQAEEKELRKRSGELTKALLAESVKSDGGSKARYAAIQTDLAGVERDLGNLLDRFHVADPKDAPRRAARGATASDIAAVLPKDAVLLDFVRLTTGAPNRTPSAESPETDAFLVFALRGNSQGKVDLSVHRLGGTPGEIAKKAAALRTLCATPTGDWMPAAKDLHSALFGQVKTKAKRLIVCPDGGLWDTPIAVLTDTKGEPLLKRQEVEYAYSANMWLQTFRQRDAQRKTADKNATIVAFADPRFGAKSILPGNVGGVAEQRSFSAPDGNAAQSGATRIAPLPGTRAEADAIAKTFPGTITFTGADATETNLRKSIAGARYLHIATHGFVNDTEPLLSALVLAEPSQPTAGDDGRLTAGEIFGLNLSRTEMTVLSACNTGRGGNKNGEGVVGLTWSLFAAGCPAQVVSQWAVNDAATSSLMGRFYTELKAGKAKGGSLREAALSLARNPQTSHPYYWASFVLFGN
jgi:tetratricopeptide (TPR) repeat protein